MRHRTGTWLAALLISHNIQNGALRGSGKAMLRLAFFFLCLFVMRQAYDLLGYAGIAVGAVWCGLMAHGLKWASGLGK